MQGVATGLQRSVDSLLVMSTSDGVAPFRRRLPTGLGVLGMVLLAACGGGAATSGPGGPGATTGAAATQAGGGAATEPAGGGGSAVKPCDLLTDEQIKAATGFSPISETAGPTMGIFQIGCEWELDNTGSEIGRAH